jgi:hypothetical protein
MMISSDDLLLIRGTSADDSHSRQGLHIRSPALIYKARDDTAPQVNGLLLIFVGTAAFTCFPC